MSQFIQKILVTAFALALLTSQGWAAEPVAPSSLSRLALEAKDQFRPVTEQDVAARKQELTDALSALDKELAGAAPAVAESLNQFLRRDVLAQQLEKESPDYNVLQENLSLYFQNEDGVERAAVRSVRESLARYADAMHVVSDQGFAQAFPARIEDLAKRLDQYQAAPSDEDRIAIGRTLDWLERAGQTPQLIKAVREAFWHPNLYAEVSQKFVESAVGQDVNEVQRVRDCIMGTSLRGTARLTGSLSAELVPDAERAVLDLSLAGRANSSNVGYNGPVKIYSTGLTNIFARKRIYLDAEGLSADGAVADCSTRSRVNSISAKCGLVRRVAWKKVRQSKPQAERVASAHADAQVSGRFDGRVTEMLDRANGNYTDRFRTPLLRRDAFPSSLRFSTTENQLLVEALSAGSAQTAATTTPPAVEGNYDLSVRVHDSLVRNVGESLIGGEKLDNEGLAKLLEDMKLEVPEELRVGPDADPWSITFTRDQPLSVLFDEQKITIVLQGRQFSFKEQDIRRVVRISAIYVPTKVEGGMSLLRDGEVVVEFPPETSLSVKLVTIKTFFRRKFNALFKAELDAKQLRIPGPWDETTPVQLTNIQPVAGWLTLGWTQSAAAQSDQVAQSDSNHSEVTSTP